MDSCRYPPAFSFVKTKEGKGEEKLGRRADTSVALVATGVFTREYRHWMSLRRHQRTRLAFVVEGVLRSRCRQTSNNQWKTLGTIFEAIRVSKLDHRSSERPLTGETHLSSYGVRVRWSRFLRSIARYRL